MSSSTPTPLTVLISGASGLIGRDLRQALVTRGHSVHTLVRREPTDSTEHHWDPTAGTIDRDIVDYADAVVNLSGASIAKLPWTTSHKRAILDSRLTATRTLVDAIHRSTTPPGVLVNASAVGIYGSRGDDELSEDSERGSGFLANVVAAWEAETTPLEGTSTRVALARTGLVIARGGAMAPVRLQTLLGVGGPIGSGAQWWPWISLHDEVRALVFLLEHPVSGPVNLVGPEPATSRQVTRALASALKRPHWLGLPEFAVTLLLQEAGEELLLSSQQIHPRVLLDAGFVFDDQTIEQAISRIV